MNKQKYFCISLDFELRWGMHDRFKLDFNRYRQELLNTPSQILFLLDALDKYSFCSTWACVGALGCENWDEYFSIAPKPPFYHRKELSFDPNTSKIDPLGKLHFAPDLVSQIANNSSHEIACHTFSHVYLAEPGVTEGDFRADLNACKELFYEKFKVDMKSFVFPRNQVAMTEVLKEMGFLVFRDVQKGWQYNETSSVKKKLPALLRISNDLMPTACKFDRLNKFRANQYIRFNLPEVFWDLHLIKIKQSIQKMKPGDVFHLWFHPHNLGFNTAVARVRVKQLFALLNDSHLESVKMSDLVNL